jgi:hypothetical protein
MAVKITYTLEFRDHLEALRYHHRTQTALVAAVLFGMGILFWVLQGTWYVLACVLAYVLVARPYIVRQRLWRNLQRTGQTNQPPTTYEFDEEGLHGTTDGGQPATTPWGQFHRVHESPELFLLYLSPRVFLCLPKRALATREQNELRRLCREHVTPRLPEGSDI